MADIERQWYRTGYTEISSQDIFSRQQILKDRGFDYNRSDNYGSAVLLERVLAWDRQNAADIMGVHRLPEDIGFLWNFAAKTNSALEYLEWYQKALRTNPFLKGSGQEYSVGNNNNLLRNIGWGFFVLDFARREALARVIKDHPNQITFCQYHGDISMAYWYESTDWSTWTWGEYRDKNFTRENVLRKWLMNENRYQRGHLRNISGESFNFAYGVFYRKS